ncbi:MAG: hypothetical protein OEY24_05000 [Candidatus Bathyarchaeota archaeon]|nr:hypothetical protein [Candidatus Bathyarchaeota archaeon]MDH5495039.1 hypothetical protein [Candidatus Bathyarchaeota archaeon]
MSEQVTEKKEALAKAFAKELGGDMVPVHVTLFQPFHDFLKEHLEFFGSKQTIADVCREMIYKEAHKLHDMVTPNEDSYVNSQNWFSKRSHIEITKELCGDREESDMAELSL